ncbi:hypothetical protein [Streptomyces sp. MUSC 14]|uniref:hypothetical protein n=1 Tax=Streptomyces sp. MUSC 14 TaxID=1354889 RepID=UPI0035287D04
MDAKVPLNGGGDDAVASVPECLGGPFDQFAQPDHLGAQGNQFVVALGLLLAVPLLQRPQK